MIKITPSAVDKMIDVLVDNRAFILRFGLQGGGCNGFTYVFSIESAVEEGDVEYTLAGDFKLVVDPISSVYLEESEIDYKRDLMGESFVFNNPNQKASCGCGNSVSF